MKTTTNNWPNRLSDKGIVRNFLMLSMAYLITGMVIGLICCFQYIQPSLLKSPITFQKTRPLHVYLVISWIFTAAQAGIYYYLPKISNRNLFWPGGARLHFLMQASVSLVIVISFFLGKFGGREYLEFPPLLGLLIIGSWVPFAIIFFKTLTPDFRTAPVYVWNWSTGILFFFITFSESYLWVFDYFGINSVRDVTVQWKAMGSMVGSWNMLIYGTGIYIMEKISGDKSIAHSKIAFSLYFLGLTNLMFNWGHHTYIVPAAPWVKSVAYIISMTELLLFAHIILNWKKSITAAQRHYHNIPYRLLLFADIWIFLNLALAIAISIPALNFYTHGTHITVAHAMGTTIGINTLILFASAFFIIQENSESFPVNVKMWVGRAILIVNTSLLIFWISLLGSGLVKISSKLNNETFYLMMQKCQPYFNLLSISGTILLIGLLILSGIAIYMIDRPEKQIIALPSLRSSH